MSIIAAFMVPHPPMIVPQIGRGSEEQIRATTEAYRRVAEEIARLKPETIIISSPHTTMYMDYFHVSPGRWADGDFGQFGVPQVSFHQEYDTELVQKIDELAAGQDFPAGTMGEQEPSLDHGTMVPLHFILQQYTDFRLVRLGLSGLDLKSHYSLGLLLQEAADQLDRRVVYVASGDLSHKLQDYGPYGYAPEGPQYDARIMDVCSRAAFDELFDFDENFCDKAAECGHRSFVIMTGALDGYEVEAQQLSHEDVTGVGYGICTFYPKGRSEDRHFLMQYLQRQERALEERRAAEDPYVKLARQSLESYIKEGRIIRPSEDLPEEMLHTRAGAFVSIHEHGSLRGCIGTIGPVRGCIAEEIIRNAISASTEDPRFSPIREAELPWLEINVDVLGEPEHIGSTDELDVKRYGVIVTNGGRRGLLLPDLDGVDTPEQQVAIARQKAGIRADESVELQRFEVRRHK